MRQTIAALALVLVAVHEPVRADPAAEFLTLARNAIADPATLARVHSLYLLVNSREMGATGGQMDRIDSPRPNQEAIWLAPPARYLVQDGSTAIGFDNARLIDTGPLLANRPILTNELRHWALALLLYDPAALGVAVRDLGTRRVGRRQLHVLDATAAHFDMRLDFDPDSHRLVMALESIRVREYSAGRGSGVRRMPGRVRQLIERETFESYRRVEGLELPFFIATSDEDGMRLQDVLKYEVNPADLDEQFRP